MSTLVIGNHYYGHAEDLAQAKKNFTKHGGRLSLGYTVFEFAEDQEFAGVDDMGYVHWKGNTEQPKSYEIRGNHHVRSSTR